MILVVLLQDVLGQRVEVDAAVGQLPQDLLLVDRMRLVEADDRFDARRFRHRCLPMCLARRR